MKAVDFCEKAIETGDVCLCHAPGGPVRQCCYGCKHAHEITCTFACAIALEALHPEEATP